MPFRNDDVALETRIASLEDEVARGRAKLAAEDAAHAPPRAIAWLLRPGVVLALSVVGTMALFPVGRAMHRRALDDLLPARVRERVFAASEAIARACVGTDRYADVDLVLSVDEEGRLTDTEAATRAFSLADRRALDAEGTSAVERCVLDALPRAFGGSTRPSETAMVLRLLPAKAGAR